MSAHGTLAAVRERRSQDLARTTFQLLALGALIASSFWILKPFLIASTWAATIAIATWPVLLRTQRWVGGRRSIAVGVMALALLLMLLIPFYFAITAVVENAWRVVEWSKSVDTITLPELPAWVAGLPAVGPRIATRWHRVVAATPEELTTHLAPFARTAVLWFVGHVGSLGLLLVHLLLTVVVATILYANGETAAHGAERFARRLLGARGEDALHLAGRAVRAVALGVVITAVVQSALVAIGLAIAGVPFVAVLTALVFILAIAQIGPVLVLIPVTVSVYARTGPVWGTAFLAWAIVCGTIDNFLRPVLIRRGADLPLLLVFAGVIGGLIAFGIIGLFIGPVVLAVAYTLLAEWVAEDDAA